MEYKIINFSGLIVDIQEELDNLAKEGWRVVGMNAGWVILERPIKSS